METGDTIEVPATFAKDFDAVELPYRGGRFAALVIMPKTQSLGDFVNDLTPASFQQIVTGLSTTTLNLSMPKVQLTDNHDLDPTLQALGIHDAFQPDADLSGMSTAADLVVQQVQQNTFLDVTEEGTEAAAATGISAIASSGVFPSYSMTIDHPYLFVVRDTTTGAVLFSAEVENPAA